MSRRFSEREDVLRLKKEAVEAINDETLFWCFRASAHDVLALIEMLERMDARVDRMKGIISTLREKAS
jgi:hypothetical protein